MPTEEEIEFLLGMIDHDFSPIEDQNKAEAILERLKLWIKEKKNAPMS